MSILVAAEREALALWSQHQGFEAIANQDLEEFRDASLGVADDEEAFAGQLADELGMLPSQHRWPTSYIDWTRAARNFFINDFWSAWASDGRVHVFRCR